MTKIKGTVVVDAERCKGCELCVVACPMKVLALSGEVNGKGYRFSRMVARGLYGLRFLRERLSR